MLKQVQHDKFRFLTIFLHTLSTYFPVIFTQIAVMFSSMNFYVPNLPTFASVIFVCNKNRRADGI